MKMVLHYVNFIPYSLESFFTHNMNGLGPFPLRGHATYLLLHRLVLYECCPPSLSVKFHILYKGACVTHEKENKKGLNLFRAECATIVFFILNLHQVKKKMYISECSVPPAPLVVIILSVCVTFHGS